MTALKRTLRGQGRTTTWLVRQLGVSLTTGYQWTSGKAIPTDPHKIKIASVLGVSVGELFFSDNGDNE